jgi:hypothetical protein
MLFRPVRPAPVAHGREIVPILRDQNLFEPFSGRAVPQALEFIPASGTQTRRTTMSRKIILSLAAAATIAVASLASQSADARGFGGGFGGGRSFGGGGGLGGGDHFARAAFTGHGGRTIQ